MVGGERHPSRSVSDLMATYGNSGRRSYSSTQPWEPAAATSYRGATHAHIEQSMGALLASAEQVLSAFTLESFTNWSTQDQSP